VCSLKLLSHRPIDNTPDDLANTIVQNQPRTFVVEAVDAVDAGTLVVAAKQEEVFGIFDLVCEQQADGLERLFAAVDVVSEEQVVALWWKSAVLEQSQQVVVLTVNIACCMATKPSP